MLEYSSPNIAARQAGLLTYDFLAQVKLFYSTWNEERKSVGSKYLISKLKIGGNILKIFKGAGYSSPYSHNTYSQYIFKFPGINGLKTSDIQLCLRSHSWVTTLAEFEVVYRNKYHEANVYLE